MRRGSVAFGFRAAAAGVAAARPLPKSVGLMLDAGGADSYAYPAESTFPIPSDVGTWGHTTHDLPSEHGAGRDGDGESGVHAP